MYDIIVRFPNKDVAEDWCAQMSDGAGEGICDFRYHRQKDGTSGENREDYELVVEDGKNVYFVYGVFDE